MRRPYSVFWLPFDNAGSRPSAVPEVTTCLQRIAKWKSTPQHVRMTDFLHRLREPMTLTGLFTLAAVALSLQFVARPLLPAATLLLGLFILFFILLTTGTAERHRTRQLALLLMPATALMLAWIMPRIGTAQVLLVIWTACVFRVWPWRRAVAITLLVNACFYFLARASGIGSPLIVVLINLGFQALAGMCVHYALTAEHSRDQLALVNADLLATRALLADSARDAERLRMARELHDVAGHKLTAMNLNLRVLSTDPAFAGRQELELMQRLSSELLSDIRNVVQALRDSRGLDLETALRALAAPLPRPRLELYLDPHLQITDAAQAETVLRLVQEALTNAARHANAGALKVNLRCAADTLELHIEDDGKLGGALREGNGLAGMRERVATAGGQLRLSQTAQGGLRIDASLPA